MNRTHRIVWSESHSAFIVTHEHAKAKGKPSSIRKALASAVVMALAAMAAAPALADSSCTGGVISITGPETSPCSLANGDALTVTNTGSIISGSSAAVYVTGGASAGSISNSGRITSTRSNGYGIYLNSGATGSITNNADSIISGGTSSGTGIHLRSGSSVTGGIINSGTISGGSSSYGFGIYLSDSSVTGGIINSGTISGGTSSSSAGIYLRSGSSVTGGIINSGTISGFTGINISDSSVTEGITNLGGTISGSSNGIALSSNSTVGSILNSGTISASNGAAIYIRGLSSITGNIENIGVAALISGSTGIYVSNSSIGGSIINSGTISGTRSWGSGIYLSNSDITGDISNGATGTISGGTTSGAGISFRSGSSITGGITNSGTISGVIGISVRDGGSVTGGITNNATGTIFGGTGIDISGSGTVVASILNSGTISATYGGVYIHGGSSVAGNIDNNGAAALISGSSGIYVGSNGSIGGSIVNSGTITGTRSWGSGIYLSNSTIAGDIRNDANSEISGGTSSSGAGISMFNSSITGSIVNSGTISGVIGINVNGSTVAGGITNNADGTISGNSTGIKISGSSTVVASLLNSGTISGVTNAIYVDGSAALPNIDIIGTTAHLIGDVFAQNTALNITSGASFTSQGAFDVGSFDIANTGRFNMANDVTTATSFTNAGTLAVAEGVTATISGDYTQASTGVFQTGISGNAVYGQLAVTGTADLSASNNFAVNVAGSPLLTVGTTLANAFASTGTLTTGATLSTTDNSALYDFTAVKNANAVDIVIAPAAGVTISGATSNIFTSVGALDGAVVLPDTAILNLNGTAGSIVGAVTGGADSTVNVNGTFTTGNIFSVGTFNVANGGLLNMAHDVTTATSFTNAGTLAVAEGVTATISGDYTQASTGIFQIGASSNSIYGKLVVSGTATLPADAMIDVNVNSVNTLANGQTLTGVIAAGTLSATTFAVTDNSTLFNFTGAVNGNAVDLTIAKATSVLDAFTTSGSGSGAGAATVLDQLIDAEADGDMGTVITALGTLSTDQEVADAVQQTLPLLSSGMSQVTTNALHGTNRIIQSRQDSNKGLSSGDEFLGDRQFWLKPVGSWTNQDDRKGVSGYDASTYGLVFGADGVVSDTTRVGAAFSYMHSNVDGNSTVAAQSASVKGYQAIAYGSFSLDERTDISVQGDIGNNKNKGRRTIDFGGLNRVARSDYDSWSAHIGAGLGRTFELNPKTSFVPSLRADYTWIADESYTESGAGALNLKVRRNTTDELILALDGKLAHACTEHATVTANLGLGYDVLAEKAAISAAFTGGGAQFVTKGLDPSPWMLRGGLGLAMTTSSAMEISARYDFEVRQDFDNQTASVKLRIPF